MRRMVLFCSVFAIGALTAGALSDASAATATPATVRLTGLNRAGKVVDVTQAELMEQQPQQGFPILYQGSPVRVDPGTYIIATEVPTYAAGDKVISETLVFRKISIHGGTTIRFDAAHGEQLTVALAGATASNEFLEAGVCLAISPSDEVGEAAAGGAGVAVYAVPVKSGNISFGYLSILQSQAGATYYLTGSARNEIPSRLAYRQNAAGLAKLTMMLRGGAFSTADMDWAIQTGTSTSLCSSGQDTQATAPQSWVNYLTPGTWTTSALERDAYAFYATRDYRAGHAYTDAFGAAVVGPVDDFPGFTASDDQFSWSPLLGSAGLDGSSICCDRFNGTLKAGSDVIKRVTNGSSLNATLHQDGWYTLTAAVTRTLPAYTPADLLSRQLAVSYRFHIPPSPPGNGSEEYLPLTDAEYQALGLNLENRAPAGGTTKLVISVSRPGDAGVATPVYRLKSVTVYASINNGTTWQRLALKAVDGSWLATVHDPSSGYVAIRSVVTDVHGDRTEQTVYRAYAVS